MATKSTMSLLSVIEEEERLWSSQLQSDREDALQRYRGEAYGDEQEGLSGLVVKKRNASVGEGLVHRAPQRMTADQRAEAGHAGEHPGEVPLAAVGGGVSGALEELAQGWDPGGDGHAVVDDAVFGEFGELARNLVDAIARCDDQRHHAFKWEVRSGL